MQSLKQPRGGFTIEILIAFAIVAIALTGATLVALGGQTSGMDMRLTGGGLNREVTLYEKNMAHGYGSWSTLASVAASNPSLDQGYSTSTTVGYTSPCVKEVTSRVSWTSDKSRSLSASVTTLVASVAEARLLGGGCDPLTPLEGWENPGSFGSIDVSGADGTGIAARWVSGHRYVFLTADPSSSAKEDLYIFSADTPNSPTLVAAINTGKGLNDIVVADGYAYVVQNDKTNQLQVINVTDPANPVVETSVPLPGVDQNGSFPQGRTITYLNDRVYIGTKETAGPEFHIFDVSTPASPVHLGSLEVTHNVNDIIVRGSTAYLATSANHGELVLLNIATPGSLSLPPSFSTPDTMNMKFNARTHVATPAESDEDGITLDVVGTTVFLGRERATNANERDFYIIDASNQNALVERGSVRLGLGSNTEVSGVTVQGKYAFIMSTDSNNPFYVYNIGTPASPLLASVCTFNYSQVTRALTYLDNYIFTANRSNDILRIIYDKPAASCS